MNEWNMANGSMYRPMQPSSQLPTSNTSLIPQVNNNLIWVQGEVGANAYPTAPNTVVWLMDCNEPKLYVKRTDVTGRPYPLEKYRLVKDDEVQQTPSYVTAEQMDAKIQELRDTIDSMSKKFVIRKPRKEINHG